MEDLGEADVILQIKFSTIDERIELSQSYYIEKILNSINLMPHQ